MKTSTAISTLVSLIALGALTPSNGAAQTACYVPGSGTVYRIKAPNTPAQCGKGHVEFQLAGAAAASGASAAGGPGGGNANLSGPAGGDLGGDYPNPSVVKIQGKPVINMVPNAGQVLTYNGTMWVPQAPLPTNFGGAFDFSNPVGMVSIGNAISGIVPVTGAGTRLVWAPGRQAFRAGTVDGAQWDAANVGYASAAFNRNNTASGLASTAFGYGTKATGQSSVAFGDGTTASGLTSLAAGSFSTAVGSASMAFGYLSGAGGAYSFAAGNQSNAMGRTSIALGTANLANADSSVAIGSGVYVEGKGAVGIGTHLDVRSTNSVALGTYASTYGHPGSIVISDGSTSVVGGYVEPAADNQFVVRAQHIWFGSTGIVHATAGRYIETGTGAYLSTGGTWTNTSDVNKKHAFKNIDSDTLLARLAAMPVSTWTYNTESDSVRHMGPTAQDFRKAFGLGDTDKAIATVDADGVSLAAVKALAQRIAQLRAESDERTSQLRKENADLRALLGDLAQRLLQLEQARR